MNTIRTLLNRAQIIITIPLLLLLAFAFGAVGQPPDHQYASPPQTILLQSDAKVLQREAEKTICSKGYLPGCPVKHGGKSLGTGSSGNTSKCPVLGADDQGGYTGQKRKVHMGALAESMIAAFDSNTEITWTTEGPSVAIASFTQGGARVTTTFSRISDIGLQVGFDVASDRQSANEIAQSSIRIFSGVFQAVREFLEVRQPVKLVFASKNQSLGELYEAYLKRQDTPLSQLGYEMEPLIKSSPLAEFTIRKKTSSDWRD